MHNNPFGQFIQGNGNPTVKNPDAFVKINFMAFKTAVALVLKKFHAVSGYISTLDVTSYTTTSTSGGWFRKTTTTTIHYNAKPVWTLVLPAGAAPGGYNAGYTMPICNINTVSPITGSTKQGAIQNAKLWATPGMLEGGITAVNTGNHWQAAMTVPAGVEFINQGAHPLNLSQSQWQLYNYSQSQSGFTFLATILLVVVVTALTAGAGTVILGAMAPSMAAVIGSYSLVGSGVLGALSTGAATGLLTSTMFGTACFGACGHDKTGQLFGSAGYGLTLAGNGNTVSTSAPVLTFNLNAYLNAQNAVNYASGVSTDSNAGNPNVFGGASGIIGASTNAVTPTTPQGANSTQLSSQGVRFNHQANQTNAINVPDSIMRWTTSRSVTSPVGSLPPLS